MPFDVYTGNQIPKGQRSVALRFIFRHPERALSDPEVDGYMGNVMSSLRKEGYDIRG
jgi:phenylalanyl-tRNA synthetase beta chain